MKVCSLARGGKIFGGSCVRPIFYPSVSQGIGIAQVGWFRGGEAAPSHRELEAPAFVELACTSTGRSFQPRINPPFPRFLFGCSLLPRRLRRQAGWLHLMEQPPHPAIGHRCDDQTSRLAAVTEPA